jgi:hypothetical protein
VDQIAIASVAVEFVRQVTEEPAEDIMVLLGGLPIVQAIRTTINAVLGSIGPYPFEVSESLSSLPNGRSVIRWQAPNLDLHLGFDHHGEPVVTDASVYSEEVRFFDSFRIDIT